MEMLCKDHLDEALFDIPEELNLDLCMAMDPRLILQRVPSDEDLDAIEAQSFRVQADAYFTDRRTSIRQTCI